jgi:hypothetical protein
MNFRPARNPNGLWAARGSSAIVAIPSIPTVEALPVIRLNPTATLAELCTRLPLLCDDGR